MLESACMPMMGLDQSLTLGGSSIPVGNHCCPVKLEKRHLWPVSFSEAGHCIFCE